MLEIDTQPAIVVVRGGSAAAEKLLGHALRQAREYSIDGAPMYSISVSLAVGGWSLDDLLAGPLRAPTPLDITAMRT